MSKREECARRLIDLDPTMSGYHETHIAVKLPMVDAILDALMEPDETMVDSGCAEMQSISALQHDYRGDAREVFRAMIQAAKESGE